jgi:oxepin-CoA hydrolase/3-oxo-5,6-dehydrosuberyl-CoA semialdehyde dehydrogenase
VGHAGEAGPRTPRRRSQRGQAGDPDPYLTELVVRSIIDSGLLPEGSLQFVAGSVGDLLDHLGPRTCCRSPGPRPQQEHLRTHRGLVEHAVWCNAEAGSLNCSILGPDALPGTPEFDLYADQLVTEMTVMAG